jgi:hypothetical protein
MGLSLPIRVRWQICKQGHEIVKVPRKGKPERIVLRERSAEREPVNYGIEQDKPLFPEYAAIDATNPYAFVEFCDRFGMPWPDSFGHEPTETELIGGSIKVLEPGTSVFQLRRAMAHVKSGGYHSLDNLQMALMQTAKPKLRVELWLEAEDDRGVEPYLAPTNLLGFIWCEFLATIGTMRETRRCEVCGTMFAVGQGSGHRRSRVYCSTRCRVAASRARAPTG